MGSCNEIKIEAQFEKQFPSIDLAYDHAVKSYELAEKRYDVIDNKLQSLMTFAITVALAIPVFLKGKGYYYKSYWVIASLLTFIVAVGLCLTARLWGTIILPRPMQFHDSWLHLEQAEFKSQFIYFAGKHFDDNCKVVNRKGKMATYSTLLYFISACLFAVWVFRQS